MVNHIPVNVSNCGLCGEVFNADDENTLVWNHGVGPFQQFRYTECLKCGSATLRNRPDQYEKREYYSSEYYTTRERSYLKCWLDKQFVRQSFIGRIYSKFVGGYPGFEEYRKIGLSEVVLDYGGGDGRLTNCLRELGIGHACSYDPFGLQDTNRIWATQWTTVILEHSFEHIDFVIELLQSLEWKKLIITVPIYDSSARKYFKESWLGFDAPRHVFIPSKKFMRDILPTYIGAKLTRSVEVGQGSHCSISEYLDKTGNRPSAIRTGISRLLRSNKTEKLDTEYSRILNNSDSVMFIYEK